MVDEFGAWAQIVAAARAVKGLQTVILPSKVSLSAKYRNVIARYIETGRKPEKRMYLNRITPIGFLGSNAEKEVSNTANSAVFSLATQTS
jgi:hypothetical protein